jgi:hypothetical protein
VGGGSCEGQGRTQPAEAVRSSVSDRPAPTCCDVPTSTEQEWEGGNNRALPQSKQHATTCTAVSWKGAGVIDRSATPRVPSPW